MQPKLTMVIPCFNELDGLPFLLHELSLYVKTRCVNFILVDNGSHDDSWNYLQNIELPHEIRTVHLETNLGYGHGIYKGLQLADTPYVGWIHADLQIPLESISHALDFLNGDDLFIKGYRGGRSLQDRFFTSSMSVLISFLFQKILKDINGQPTIMSRKLFESWKNKPNDFSFDLSAYVHARNVRVPVKRIPVTMHPREHGSSSWNSGFSSRLVMVRRTLVYAWRSRFEL